MKTISAAELQNKLSAKESVQLIDIREPFEFEDGSLCETNIPMDDLVNDASAIHSDNQAVIVCQTGRRASALIYMLEKKYKLDNLYCLEGGYVAFQELSK